MKVATVTRLVTPGEPCRLGGYGMRTEKWKGIMHELKCTAIVLEVENEKLVFCDAEVLFVHTEAVKNIKMQLEENFGIKPEFVTIASVHTHAAPLMKGLSFEEEMAAEKAYAEYLSKRIYEIISEALEAEMIEVEASYKTICVDGFYGNRIGKGNPEDKDVTIIKFVNGENINAAIVNISCHPTVLGADNLYVSGDLLGYISTAFYEKHGVYPLMMQGACGDMSNRNYRKGHDLEELKRTGDGIAAQILESCDGFVPLKLSKPKVRQYSYQNEHKLDLEYWKNLRAETEANYNKETNYDKKKIFLSSIYGIDAKIANPEIKVDFNASILRLGDIEICQQPGELFSHFGKQIKAASSAKLPLIWGYANGYFGYLPDELMYGKTYEGAMSPLEPGEANEITEDLVELMKGGSNS